MTSTLLSYQITSQYAYCFEMKQFSSTVPRSSPQCSFVIDNVCMDLNGFTCHFLSSAQGGTTSFITAPISKMTVILLDSTVIGIELRLPSRPVGDIRCQFYSRAHVSHLYNIIYESRSLTVICSFRLMLNPWYEFDMV